MKGKEILHFFLYMQRFIGLKEKNSNLLILLRFMFWVLFCVEENASPQPISIRISYHPRQTGLFLHPHKAATELTVPQLTYTVSWQN